MKRGTRIVLFIAGLATICSVGTCGIAIAAADSLPVIAGCTDRGAEPDVSGVLDDVRRIREEVPGLSQAISGHYRWKETRPRTCPDLYPMTYRYEGFAVLPPDLSSELAARGQPAVLPSVPEPLQQYAPSGASWVKVDELYLDPASRTVWFNYVER